MGPNNHKTRGVYIFRPPFPWYLIYFIFGPKVWMLLFFCSLFKTFEWLPFWSMDLYLATSWPACSYKSTDHFHKSTALNIVFSVIWYFMLLWWLFQWDFLWMGLQVWPWMIEIWMNSQANYSNKFWYVSHPNISIIKMLSQIIKIWMKKIHLVGDNNCNIIKSTMSKCVFYKKWQIMLS